MLADNSQADTRWVLRASVMIAIMYGYNVHTILCIFTQYMYAIKARNYTVCVHTCTWSCTKWLAWFPGPITSFSVLCAENLKRWGSLGTSYAIYDFFLIDDVRYWFRSMVWLVELLWSLLCCWLPSLYAAAIGVEKEGELCMREGGEGGGRGGDRGR